MKEHVEYKYIFIFNNIINEEMYENEKNQV